MTYYFGSKEQVNGDIKYNEHDFAAALKYYKKGLENLQQIAAQRNFTANRAFNDALAYVLSDVVVCATDLLRASLKGKLNYPEITQAWKEISSALQELQVVCDNTSIQRFTGSQTTPERLNMVYSAVALAAEAVSDRLIDWLDRAKKTPTEKQFLIALTWLKRAMDNFDKAGEEIEAELHIGYLNLLERAFHCEKNKRILTRITNYIQNNSVHELELSAQYKLELLGYELLVAVENNDSAAHELARQCNVLIKVTTDIDEESELIADLRKLMARLPVDNEEVKIPKKIEKRRRIIIDEEEEELHMATSTEVPDVAMDSQAKFRKVDVMDLEEPFYTSDVVPMDSTLERNRPTATPMQLEASEVSAHVVPTTSLFANTFFVPSARAAQTTTVTPLGHHKAFKKAMFHIAENYNNTGFLANLLSVFSDFYYKSKDLPFKNLPITAYSLYSAVLKLNPQHQVAISRMKSLYRHNPRMINDNKHFATSMVSQAINAHEIFVNAIKDNIREVETYLSTKPEQLDALFNQFILFITKAIKEEGIAGKQSTLIAELLKSKYDNFVLAKALSQFSENQPTQFELR
ncbi:hypothetical protein [Legionella saoudiensis]|uniref:hypothetical protein n=1 Tax=Legionella saoudiensis TaxID=1750561 RepID=UPI0007311D78|nr:hypothetical protein [Legionella saoudiensis]